MLVQRNVPFTKTINYDYVSIDNKSLEDIVQVLYTWQQLKADPDDSFLIKKLSLNEIILNDATKDFTIEIGPNDFQDVLDNEIYFEIFSIKYVGDVNFRDTILKNADNDTYSTIQIESSWTQQ